MNKWIFYCTAICIIIVSCKSDKKTEQDKPIETSLNFLKGTWQNALSPVPDFTIEQDSIAFLQEDAGHKFKFELEKDSLIIHFPAFVYAFKVSCYKGDSIHLDNEMNSNTFFKIK
ncbi:MAG: hypothetical protein ABI851_10355 [Saprospiraceae bacterium]